MTFVALSYILITVCIEYNNVLEAKSLRQFFIKYATQAISHITSSAQHQHNVRIVASSILLTFAA
jgi:hypothetical protein